LEHCSEEELREKELFYLNIYLPEYNELNKIDTPKSPEYKKAISAIINQHKEKTLQVANLYTVDGLLRAVIEYDKSLGISYAKESNELPMILSQQDSLYTNKLAGVSGKDSFNKGKIEANKEQGVKIRTRLFSEETKLSNL
jgi:hypothetical protein